jgi:protease stability complex PrcB-like protein
MNSRCLVAAIGLSLGCAEASQIATQDSADRLGSWVPEPGATLLHSSLSSLGNPTLAVVSYPAAWRALWTEAWGGLQVSPTLPVIDFVLSSVIVVGLGKRAGPGYSVTIDSIVVRTGGSVLFATEVQPGAHCDASGAPSAPVHMVQMPGHPPIIDWQVGTVRRDCPS